MIERSAQTSAMDGRTARSERTRKALADAVLGLLYEGRLRPTAEEVAQRAGTSVRSVFQHFKDMEALLLAVAAQQELRLQQANRPLPLDLPLPKRIAAFVAMRCEVLETLAPVRRTALLYAPFSPLVATRLRQVRALMRKRVAATFAGEISRQEPARRAQIAAAIGAICGYSLWENLRVHQGLSKQRAAAVVSLMLEQMLVAPAA